MGKVKTSADLLTCKFRNFVVFSLLKLLSMPFRSEAKAASTHQASAEGQEGSSSDGETSCGQNTFEEHDSSA